MLSPPPKRSKEGVFVFASFINRFWQNFTQGLGMAKRGKMNPYFTAINSSSVRTVADRHRLTAHHNNYCWRAFRGYQHRWPWTTLNPKNFEWIFRDFRLWHTFHEWTAPKSLRIDQDNLLMKFSGLNIDFKFVSFDPLGSSSPPYEGIKFGYPLQNARFLLLSTDLAWERLQIDTDLLPIITTIGDELSGGTNIDDLERLWNRKLAGLFMNFSQFQAATHI